MRPLRESARRLRAIAQSRNARTSEVMRMSLFRNDETWPALRCSLRRSFTLPIVCLLLLAAPFGDAAAQATDADAIRAVLARGSIPELHRGDFASYRQALDDSYRPGGYAALWLAPQAAAPILAELKDAPSHGLDPKDYDVAWLEGEFNAIAAGDKAPERRARADVALTVSFFRLLDDLHDGRVSPARAGFKIDVPSTPLDYAAILRRGKETDLWHEAV